MCKTSAYFTRCETCKQDIDHCLKVDQNCKNKNRGLPYCSIIYPVNMNIDWATIDQEAKEMAEQPPPKTESDDTLIMKQLVDDIDNRVNMEKHGRVENWLDGHPNVKAGEWFDEVEEDVIEEETGSDRGRGRSRGRARGRGRRGN
ncbi:hypothetical protein FVEN_g2003 [Fusarium venenatum]|uniref:Uncharacterized protein n=1 Tax=Fusarium venenatum TaxID=56646 RepID=A0A2L2TDU2_9HYPO|nr:uncharacterized protein FVRRES_12413 [Fusarium venenatum]KAG8360253.1 hypothetical protein FVEN_g2003 [Fusarium venenatum]CEI39722.1 unnamed protein product [Fusarium venenatum]